MVEDGYFIPDGTQQHADRRTGTRHGHPHKAVIRTRVRKSNQMHQKKKRASSDAGSHISNDFSYVSEHFHEDGEDGGKEHGNEYSNLYASSHSTGGELSVTHNGTPLSNSAQRITTPRNTLSSRDANEIVEDMQQSSSPSGRPVPLKKNSLPLHLRPPSIAITESFSSDYDAMKISKSDNPRLNLMIKELSKLKTETETLRISYQTSERDRKVEVSQLNLQVSQIIAYLL